MSQNALNSPLRLRAARSGEPSLRERLALVPPRAVETTHIPFVVLVGLILAGGVAGLLLFNTQMQQGAFEIQRLQAQETTLAAQQQDQAMQLLRMNDPQRLATEARKFGMVAPTNPAFLDLETGKILGVPAAATRQNAMNIGSTVAAPTPASLRPPPKIVMVHKPASKTPANKTGTSTNTGKTKAGTGASSKKVHR